MQIPDIPLDETVRLKSLHSLRILDTAPEERFDRITSMVRRIFDVEMCLVSLVDSDRQWFKSRQGLDACQTSRDVSFCGHSILLPEALIVEDALKDERFADNPLVTEEPNIRFYAGYPVHAPNGQRVGTLCVIDSKPREFSDADAKTLRDFAALVDDEMAACAKMHVDELTGIANRRGFDLVTDHVLPLARRIEIGIDLLYFDLNGFKEINDELGHKAGDEALQIFADALIKSFRRADVVARMGGDEFAVMMVNSVPFSNRAVDTLRERIANDSRAVAKRIDWSVGRARFIPEIHEDIDSLLHDADTRMYAHKHNKHRLAV